MSIFLILSLFKEATYEFSQEDYHYALLLHLIHLQSLCPVLVYFEENWKFLKKVDLIISQKYI